MTRAKVYTVYGATKKGGLKGWVMYIIARNAKEARAEGKLRWRREEHLFNVRARVLCGKAYGLKMGKWEER